MKTQVIKTMKTVTFTAALLISGLTSAALVPVTNVVELDSAAIGVPAHEADRITVIPCGGCDAETVRLTTATVYRIGGSEASPVSFREFREAARLAGKDTLFYVVYTAATNQVTEVVIAGAE